VGEPNPAWTYKSEHDLLIACVGYNFGPRPLERLDEIRVSRGGYGYTVLQRMGLTPDDVVVDIGSGCGFVGRAVAPHVKTLHCVDISSDFLAYCTRELGEFANVQCHLMAYADFSALQGLGVSHAYSTAVWIHFNFYDICHYLHALAGLLPAGGTLYFDFAAPEGIASSDRRIFNSHLARYVEDRNTIFNLVHFNSPSAVEAAAGLFGFALEALWKTHEITYSALLRRLPDTKSPDPYRPSG
jgi:hypothetical protein